MKWNQRSITPMDSRYRFWEALMFFLIAYSSWSYPFKIAFVKTHLRGLCIADSIIDLFFAIDILVTFFVSYVDPRSQQLVRDSETIAVRYLSTWLVLDLASLIPFEALGYLFTGKTSINLSCCLLFILRLCRLRKVKQLFARLEKDVRLSYFFVGCVRIFSVTLFLVHCVGCLCYMLADRYPEQRKILIGSMIPHFREEKIWIRYVSTIYWTVIKMTAVGYRNLHAVNTKEMTINIIFMLFNLGLTAYVIGNMTYLILGEMHQTMEIRNNIQATSNCVDCNHVPSRFKDQLKKPRLSPYNKN